MNHKKFTYNENDLIPNKSYLTSIYSYIKDTHGELNYHGAYILESEFKRLGTLFPEISSMIAEAFCIPIIFKEKDVVSIKDEHIQKIQEQVTNTSQQIQQTFEYNTEQINEENTFIDYEGTVYNLIQHLGMILEDDGFDTETKLSFQQDLDELEKSIKYYLNKDLTSQIKEYNNNLKENIISPLAQQIVFIHRRLENFIKGLPKDVSLSLTLGHQGHFHDIKINSLSHLTQKYPQDMQITNSIGETDNTIENNEAQFTNAVNQLRIAVFQLNYIFQNPEEQENGSKVHHIHPFVTKLFDKLFKYIGSIERKPEHQKEFDIINDYINDCIVTFIQDTYEGLEPKEQLKQMHNITRNLGDTIYNAVDDILQYKKYELLSQEYKFIKDILVSLQQAHINNPTNKENEEISQRFTSLLELDTSFHIMRKPEDLKTLTNLATHYEKYDLLMKLQNNNLLPKEID